MPQLIWLYPSLLVAMLSSTDQPPGNLTIARLVSDRDVNGGMAGSMSAELPADICLTGLCIQAHRRTLVITSTPKLLWLQSI